MNVVAMRTIPAWFIVIATIVTLSSSSVSVAQANPPFSISIKPVAPVVKVGAEVYVNVTMTNTSDHDIDCTIASVNGTDRSYRFDVRDENNVSVEKKDVHPEMYPGSFHFCTLKPGASTSGDMRINWLHDLTKPGKYVVQAERGVPSEDGGGVVDSNKITITIEP